MKSSVWLGAVLLLGCGNSINGTKSSAGEGSHDEAPPLSSAAPSVTESRVDASSPSSPSSPSASASASASSSTVLTAPPWPEGTKKLTVDWIVHPATELRGGGSYGRHIDLSVRAGSVTRSLPIDARISITYATMMQPACTKGMGYGHSAVAELYMNGGGNLWYTVEPRKDGLLEVYENTSTDGQCTDARDVAIACPVDRALLGVIEAPVGATFTEHFFVVERVEGDGSHPARVRETEETCE